MHQAIKQHAIVQQGGRIEIFVPEMAVGARAEVTVSEVSPTLMKQSLSKLIGRGKGAFNDPKDADQFVRASRDEWA